MNILAIPATNSSAGINRQLLEGVAVVLADRAPDAEVEIIDLNDYEIPIYSHAREDADGVPELARELFDKIGSSDALILSFAEHNGSYTAAWKNIFDWMSRIDPGVYQGKKVAMLAATPGGRAGASVLGNATVAAPFFGAELVGSLGIPTFATSFDPEAGGLTDPDHRTKLDEILTALIA